MKEEEKRNWMENKEDFASKHTDEIQKKQLNKILMVLGVIAVVFLIGVFAVHSIRTFEYNGVDFKIVKEKNLLLYNTFFEIHSITGKHIADYNLYFRNDPRDLKDEVLFEGEIDLNTPVSKMVIKMEDSEALNCEGYGVIAIANLVKSFDLMGIEVIKDEEAECDAQGRYMYVKIRQGEESKIEQYGPSCYRLIVKECEILEVTERFIIESIAQKGEQKITIA